MTVAESLAKFLTEFSFDRIPQQVVTHAKKCVLDSVACNVGGVKTDIGTMTLGLVKELGGNPQSSIIGNGFKTSCPLAASANSRMTNALDFDDTYLGHPGATVIPPALAIAEAHGLSGRDLLCSIIAGYEISIRAIRALRPSPDRYRHEVQSLATYQIFGAVSVAGKLLGLDAVQMANAFGVAGAYAPVPAVLKIMSHDQFWPTMVKNQFDACSMVGIFAAMLAKKGFTGPTDIFDGDNGFWKISASDRCDFDAFTRGLGKDFETLNVAFKPYPCCRWIHPSIDASLAIQKEHDVDLGDVKEIIVRSVGRLTEWRPFNMRDPPKSMVEAQFCAPYAISVALSGVPEGPDWYSSCNLKNLEILKLASKVRLIPDSEADRVAYEEGRVMSTVEMKTAKGSYTFRIDSARGERDNPVTLGFIRSKFRNLASGILNHDEIKEAVNMIDCLEDVENARNLIRKLIPG